MPLTQCMKRRLLSYWSTVGYVILQHLKINYSYSFGTRFVCQRECGDTIRIKIHVLQFNLKSDSLCKVMVFSLLGLLMLATLALLLADACYVEETND